MCVIFGISVVVLYTELAWLSMKISFVNLGKQKTEDGSEQTVGRISLDRSGQIDQ